MPWITALFGRFLERRIKATKVEHSLAFVTTFKIIKKNIGQNKILNWWNKSNTFTWRYLIWFRWVSRPNTQCERQGCALHFQRKRWPGSILDGLRKGFDFGPGKINCEWNNKSESKNCITDCELSESELVKINGNPDCVALGSMGFSLIMSFGTSACCEGAVEWLPLVRLAGEIVDWMECSTFVDTGVEEWSSWSYLAETDGRDFRDTAKDSLVFSIRIFFCLCTR